MFRKALVPLDGSELSEGVLPYVSALAKGLNIPLALLTVIDLEAVDMPERLRERLRYGSVEAEIRKQLEGTVKRLADDGVRADSIVAFGHPADEIVLVAERENCDLVAMSTHARGALARGILGSVTDKVIHASHLPTLTITPETAKSHWEGGVTVSKIIVPLDGSPLAESVLPYVEHLAKRLSLEVILARAVDVGGIFAADFGFSTVPGAEDIVAEIKADATEYLKGVAERLTDRSVTVRWELLTGHPGSSIVDLARETPEDLIVLATHGRSGLTRWVLGSVAERVIRSSGWPVLVIPPPPAG